MAKTKTTADTADTEDTTEPTAAPAAVRLTRHELRQRAAAAVASQDVTKEVDAILAPGGPLDTAAQAGATESGKVLPADPLKALAIRRALESEGWTVTPSGTVQF